jgi:hypothetical protein
MGSLFNKLNIKALLFKISTLTRGCKRDGKYGGRYDDNGVQAVRAAVEASGNAHLRVVAADDVVAAVVPGYVSARRHSN